MEHSDTQKGGGARKDEVKGNPRLRFVLSKSMVLTLLACEALNSFCLSLLASLSSGTHAQVAGCGPSTMFVYLLRKYTCMEVPLMRVRQAHRGNDASVHKDVHIVTATRGHFWRHTLIHHTEA